MNSLKSSLPSLFTSTLFKKESTSISLPRLSKRVFNSSLDKKPSLFKSAALKDSLSFAAYSFVSFLSKCPAPDAARNSLKSSLPSLLTSTEFKKEFTSISFPKLSNRVFNSSLDKKPSLFKSASSNYSLSFATYSFVSFLLKCPAVAAEMNSKKSNFPSLLTSTAFKNELTSISFPKVSKRDFNSSFERTPSLFKSAALNDSLSLAAYSLLSFLVKCPADAAAINSLKSSLPSLLMSTEFKNDSTSISFPRLYKRVFNSSFDKNPS